MKFFFALLAGLAAAQQRSLAVEQVPEEPMDSFPVIASSEYSGETAPVPEEESVATQGYNTIEEPTAAPDNVEETEESTTEPNETTTQV